MSEDRQIAFVFPGQGSQTPGMGFELSQSFHSAKATFEQADDILGFPISEVAWNGPDSKLNKTVNTQPALFVTSVAIYRVIKEQLPHLTPKFMAGHSMGELTTLVTSSAASFASSLNLTRRRGELMQYAGSLMPGRMAAILGLSIEDVDKICSSASKYDELVQVANDNCPGQVVISGTSGGIEEASKIAISAGARKVRMLAVSIAAHSPLMNSVQDEFNRSVDSTEINTPRVPIIGNVNAVPLISAQDIRKDLRAQLTSRVRWTESIQYMIEHGINTFIEIGSKSVLTTLLKRINKSVTGISINKPSDLDKIKSF